MSKGKKMGKIKGKIYSADLEEDTLIIQLPKGFWKEHYIRAGEVEIETENIKRKER